MKLDTLPVNVDINISNLEIKRDAFYNLCFISENDLAPRTIRVATPNQLLSQGYSKESLAYNFLIGVLSQQTMPYVYFRAKRVGESYEQAFDADDNSSYYYVVIQDKSLPTIKAFNNHIVTRDRFKLQFFSGLNHTGLQDTKAVHYYQRPISDIDVSATNKIKLKNFYTNKAYELGYTLEPDEVINEYSLQITRLAYPESAWIARCGDDFPSKMLWLYKYLSKVDVSTTKSIPNLSSTSSKVINNKAVVGSGMTLQGLPIHEQVSLDWLKWAISKNIWNELYSSPKITATKGGKDIIENKVKEVLDVATTEDIFSEYKIKDIVLDTRNETISLKFSATLTHSILKVDVSGELYY